MVVLNIYGLFIVLCRVVWIFKWIGSSDFCLFSFVFTSCQTLKETSKTFLEVLKLICEGDTFSTYEICEVDFENGSDSSPVLEITGSV